MKKIDFESYEAYRRIQEEANKLKFANIFAEAAELQAIARHHLKYSGRPLAGLCHGVRNGFEVRYLRRMLGDTITGTDIAENAARVPHCIVWDMHEVRQEWLSSIDFIYSNSWDHTYDAELMFGRWARCLTETGRLYVTWTTKHADEGVTTETGTDSFGCSLDELIGLLRVHLELEDVIVTEPRPLLKQIRRRYAYLRMGRLKSVFAPALTTHRMVSLVLKRRR